MHLLLCPTTFDIFGNIGLYVWGSGPNSRERSPDTESFLVGLERGSVVCLGFWFTTHLLCDGKDLQSGCVYSVPAELTQAIPFPAEGKRKARQTR